MRIIPIAFDSFSTRSMATLVETDIRIFIDPSISIAPFRYGLPPTNEELEELSNGIKRIMEIGEKTDLFIITHYHWDHCPHPESDHINVLKGKRILAKDFTDTNKSQYLRGKRVYSILKDVEFCDGKSYEIGNTYLEFSEGVWHGEEKSKLGKVVMVYLEHNNDSLIFASDIQGVLTEKTKEFIINKDPKILIMSGPPIYHFKWKKGNEEINMKNLREIVENTRLERVIIDHHTARSKEYLEYLNRLNKEIKDIFMSAADFLGIKNRLLEAYRDSFYSLP